MAPAGLSAYDKLWGMMNELLPLIRVSVRQGTLGGQSLWHQVWRLLLLLLQKIIF